MGILITETLNTVYFKSKYVVPELKLESTRLLTAFDPLSLGSATGNLGRRVSLAQINFRHLLCLGRLV